MESKNINFLPHSIFYLFTDQSVTVGLQEWIVALAQRRCTQKLGLPLLAFSQETNQNARPQAKATPSQLVIGETLAHVLKHKGKVPSSS